MKYTPEIVKKICDLIEKDTFTIQEICDQIGINRATFFYWQDTKLDFSDAIKKAYDNQLKNIAEYAKKSLIKKINGYDYEEVTTELVDNGEGKPKLKSKKTVKKHIPPSDTAIIFALTNRDNLNWKHKSEVDHTTGGEKLTQKIEIEIIDSKNENSS